MMDATATPRYATSRHPHTPRVAARLGLEADEERAAGGHEVVLLHGTAERVAERLDDAGVVRPGGVVQRQRLAAVPLPGFDRRFDPVDTETENRSETAIKPAKMASGMSEFRSQFA